MNIVVETTGDTTNSNNLQRRNNNNGASSTSVICGRKCCFGYLSFSLAVLMMYALYGQNLKILDDSRSPLLQDTAAMFSSDTTMTQTRRGPGGQPPLEGAPETLNGRIEEKNDSADVSSTEKQSSYFKLGIPLKAADALQCRESVVSFVINATDVRDECEGLRRAFDKTCSSSTESHDESSKSGTSDSQRRRRMKKKSFWDKTQKSYSYHAWVFPARRLYRRIQRLFMKGPPVFFFAEDEIEETYLDASYIVEKEIEFVYTDLRRKLTFEAQQRRRLEDNKTKVSTSILDIPSANKISNQTAGDALFLQQGDSWIEKAANKTEAAEDAAKSSKAVSDSNTALTSILTDPDSVEARTCCTSILGVYNENCHSDAEEEISDTRLFFAVFVLAMCGMVKSLIRYFRLVWLPEAAGCILVGVMSGYLMMLFPHSDLSFDGNWFLRIMVPPIVFEAAISIDKRSFNRHVIPILFYAIGGTLIATILTALIVHHGSIFLSPLCPVIPYVESLTFGALISSIDPIAVLSVLSNMGMARTDTIYVTIFGESLLNDGVAIVLFQTLVHFLDENLVIDGDAIFAAAIHFLVVAIGSLLVGTASGMLSTVYYYLFQGCQTPLVEVLMFCCWALIPYYVCDGIEWSGIVAAVSAGFCMDLYIIGQESDMNGDSEHGPKHTPEKSQRGQYSRDPSRRKIFSSEGLLSNEARNHIHFVTEIIATGMETAIFAYLGLFLFSSRYHWNLFHTLLSIGACCLSRGIMIPTLSFFANIITRAQQIRAVCRVPGGRKSPIAAPAGVVIDGKMQVVLWFAGLRGAMSFALVEHIPMYDSVSGEGTRHKAELKAMTSACIMFTVFVLGGYTFSVLGVLGLAPKNNKNGAEGNVEMQSLVGNGSLMTDDSEFDWEESNTTLTNAARHRQRTIQDKR